MPARGWTKRRLGDTMTTTILVDAPSRRDPGIWGDANPGSRPQSAIAERLPWSGRFLHPGCARSNTFIPWFLDGKIFSPLRPASHQVGPGPKGSRDTRGV